MIKRVSAQWSFKQQRGGNTDEREKQAVTVCHVLSKPNAATVCPRDDSVVFNSDGGEVYSYIALLFWDDIVHI